MRKIMGQDKEKEITYTLSSQAKWIQLIEINLLSINKDSEK